jgi:hypothetical protein
MLPTEQVDTVSKARGGHAAADMGMHPGHTPVALGKKVQAEGGGTVKPLVPAGKGMPKAVKPKGMVVSPSKSAAPMSEKSGQGC